jgi:hypothetical protein
MCNRKEDVVECEELKDMNAGYIVCYEDATLESSYVEHNFSI